MSTKAMYFLLGLVALAAVVLLLGGHTGALDGTGNFLVHF